MYINKKIEFETKLKKSLGNNENPSDGNTLREKKNLIYANHEKRIENYKETLLNHFIAQSEDEKEKTNESYKKIFQKLKENYDNIKNYYETQKLIFNTEQQLNSSSSIY